MRDRGHTRRDAPRAARALGRPDDEHAGDRRVADAVDPWLFLGKLHAYAGWWAGSPDDLARPEVSPGLGRPRGLPPALMLYGTRDLLAPGCRLLARRAAEAGWDLTTVEEPDLMHVYPVLPLVPRPAAPSARRGLRCR